MFILRRISSDGVQINVVLGRRYTLVTKSANPKDFDRTFELMWKGESKQSDIYKEIYAFVSDDNDGIHSLYINQDNYIMTGGGTTFDNILFRE